MNENGVSFGKYCGNKTGQAVVVNGSLVVLRYRSEDYGSYGRFRLLFTPVYRKYNNDIQLKIKLNIRVSFTRGMLSSKKEKFIYMYIFSHSIPNKPPKSFPSTSLTWARSSKVSG